MTDTTINSGLDGNETVYWRSAEQLQGGADYEDAVGREFAEGVAESSGLDDPVSRRNFLTAAAASVAIAGLTGCRKPRRTILTYNQRPEGLIPGVPRYFATSLEQNGFGIGVLAKSSDGRPTKIDGNPGHPASLGGTNSWLHAELLNLYDPARSSGIVKDGHVHAADDAHGDDHGHGGDHADGHAHPTLADFTAWWNGRAPELTAKGGEGLVFLHAPTASPTFEGLRTTAMNAWPKAKFVAWSPVARDAEMQGAELAFGRRGFADVDYGQCRVVASFDADFLGIDALDVASSREWAGTRKITDESGDISRLYVCEGVYSVTGSNADHRFRLPTSRVTEALLALAGKLGVGQGNALGAFLQTYAGRKFEQRGKDWIAALAKDLQSQRGRSAVVVGPRQPALAHAVAWAINETLGNVGKTTTLRDAPAGLGNGASGAAVGELVASMNAGGVDTLVCLGTNPVLDAPADADFATAFAKVPNRVHLGLHVDETGLASTWHVNLAHPLETWGDSRALDGTVAIQQPLIAPLFDGLSALELVATMLQADDTEDYLIVQNHWKSQGVGGDGFDAWWKKALHDGRVEGSATAPAAAPAVRATQIAQAGGSWQQLPEPTASSLEVNIRACAKVLDGRYANNAWMQELPDPITKLTWDNAVLMSRATAEGLGLGNNDVVSLDLAGRTVEGSVWIMPGHAERSVTLHLGYGRSIGKVADGAGFNAYAVRTTGAMHVAAGAKLTKTGRRYDLVTTQDHGSMEGRALVRENNLADFKRNPSFAPDMSPLAQAAKIVGKTEDDLAVNLWRDQDRDFRAESPYQWGMVIDLNSCTGCGTCVVSCASENNVPMVGKKQVSVGREMHWNRIDRYFSGGATQDGVPTDDEPQVVHQMVPCMQCENAPCESVCPVAATVHSPDGLNDMVYNRCIGTRYCNNNCPYKVRRFNWFNFNLDVPALTQMQFNPDVTVRARGVMEKCTYCVQRINAGKFQAKKERRMVRDGEFTTACAQDCPTQAITFGNIADENSAVSAMRKSPLNYGMLSELNVRPRTTYLAKIRNPNPELAS